MKTINALNFVKNKIENLNYKLCFIIFTSIIVGGLLISLVLEPQGLLLVTKYLCILEPGRFLRSRHEAGQYLKYKIYLWNVTNPDEITAGTAKPKLQEVGPYVFRQFKDKLATSDNETEDTYSFDDFNVFTFDRQLSEPLTGDEMLTLLNPVLVAALVKVDLERPSFINIAVESMDLIFNKPKSIFIKMTGSEFIYNGVEIDCNQTAYAAKAACAEMRRNKLLKIMNAEKTRLRFRWFDSINDTTSARFTMKRGRDNIHELSNSVAVDSKRTVKAFKDDERCNVIRGSDRTIFSPLQKKSEVIWIYSAKACKSFPLRYRHTKKLWNINSALKAPIFNDTLLHPSCNCNKYTGCAINGTLDLYTCTSLFLSASSPHYYLADARQESVEGLSPSQRHQSVTYVELRSGIPIYLAERAQMNVLVKRIPDSDLLSRIAGDIWLPYMWYEENFILAYQDVVFLRRVLGLADTATAIGYVFVSIGILGCLVAGSLFIHRNVLKMRIPPNEPPLEK